MSPEPWKGCYTLHLYCRYSEESEKDNMRHVFDYRNHPTQIIGQDKADAFKHARNIGWTIHRDQTATCPRCKEARR